MNTIELSWGAVRALLSDFNFYDIKEIVGLSGLPTQYLSDIIEKKTGGNWHGILMSKIDGFVGEMEQNQYIKFAQNIIEIILQRHPEKEEKLQECFKRLGWQYRNGSIIPVEILDLSELDELPKEAHDDLIKAAERLKDGDPSGAISAACGALDTVTKKIYENFGQNDANKASFQERINVSLKLKKTFLQIEGELLNIGWEKNNANIFLKNLEGSINQAAYVMGALRRGMGDVHGTKPYVKALVFDSLKWAAIILRLLN